MEKALVGVALSAGLVLGSAGVAAADRGTGPSFGDDNNASCVAVFVDRSGAPGQIQRFVHVPSFGQEISGLARSDKVICRFGS